MRATSCKASSSKLFDSLPSASDPVTMSMDALLISITDDVPQIALTTFGNDAEEKRTIQFALDI